MHGGGHPETPPLSGEKSGRRGWEAIEQAENSNLKSNISRVSAHAPFCCSISRTLGSAPEVDDSSQNETLGALWQEFLTMDARLTGRRYLKYSDSEDSSVGSTSVLHSGYFCKFHQFSSCCYRGDNGGHRHPFRKQTSHLSRVPLGTEILETFR